MVYFSRPSSAGTYYGMLMSVHPGLRPSATVFRTFLLHALTYQAEILHLTVFLWKFDHVRVSSISVNFFFELCPFWFMEKLLHVMTHWADILQMPLLYCTTDHVWVSSICVNVCRSYDPFGTKNTGNTQFSALFSYIMRYIELKVCIWLCYTLL